MSFILYTVSEVLKGVPNTIIISIVAMIVGLIIGTLFAFIQTKKIPIISQFIVIYNSFFRSTPLIVQLFIMYYGIPKLVIWSNAQFTLTINPDIFSPLVIAFIVFSLHAVAYLSESIKGGLLSVDTDQIEAAQTVGLSTIRTYKEIILPQAFSYALPNIENQFIMLIKNFSVAAVLKLCSKPVIANEGYRFITVYSVAAIFYWLLAIVLELLFSKVENRSAQYMTSKPQHKSQ